jgi:hypothetical protein
MKSFEKIDMNEMHSNEWMPTEYNRKLIRGNDIDRGNGRVIFTLARVDCLVKMFSDVAHIIPSLLAD